MLSSLDDRRARVVLNLDHIAPGARYALMAVLLIMHSNFGNRYASRVSIHGPLASMKQMAVHSPEGTGVDDPFTIHERTGAPESQGGVQNLGHYGCNRLGINRGPLPREFDVSWSRLAVGLRVH